MNTRKIIPLAIYGFGILILALVFIIIILALEIPEVHFSPDVSSCTRHEDCYTGENPCVRQACVEGSCTSLALENTLCLMAGGKTGTCVKGYCEGCSHDSDCSGIGLCGNMECKFKRWDNRLCIPTEACVLADCSVDSDCAEKECWQTSCAGGSCSYVALSDGSDCTLENGVPGVCQSGWCGSILPSS